MIFRKEYSNIDITLNTAQNRLDSINIVLKKKKKLCRRTGLIGQAVSKNSIKKKKMKGMLGTIWIYFVEHISLEPVN